MSTPPYPARWQTHAVTVAGGYGCGNAASQLNSPFDLFVDQNQTVYIADWDNHRIMAWTVGAITGQVVAGGNGSGSRLDQLNHPTTAMVDRQSGALLICDV